MLTDIIIMITLTFGFQVHLGNISRHHLNKDEGKLLRRGFGRADLVLHYSEGKNNSAGLFCFV